MKHAFNELFQDFFMGIRMKEICLDAKIDQMQKAIEFIEGELEAIGCPPKTIMQIDVATDEIAGNICRYAYGGDSGNYYIRLDYEKEDRMITIQFADAGIPFNPLEEQDPDTTLAAEDREIGGLGIFIVKKSMDEVNYEYSNWENILTIKKKI